MNKRWTETGRASAGFFFCIYQTPEMVNPLITVSKYAIDATQKMMEKYSLYKLAKSKQ